MSKASEAILRSVQIRQRTRSELIDTACRNGCRSVRRAEIQIDDLHRQGFLETRMNRNLEIKVYYPGEKNGNQEV